MPSDSSPPSLPDAFGWLGQLFSIFGDHPPASTLPPAGDPGISAPPAVGAPGGPSIRTVPGGGGTTPGATAGGFMGPIDPNSSGAQLGTAIHDSTVGVWNNLTQVLQGIGLDLHNGIQGLQDGLPIFGVFAMLFIVFLVGLVMFLAEGGKAVGGDTTVAYVAGAVAGARKRRESANRAEVARSNAKHKRRQQLHAAGESAISK